MRLHIMHMRWCADDLMLMRALDGSNHVFERPAMRLEWQTTKA
jgi:hypothetical protein